MITAPKQRLIEFNFVIVSHLITEKILILWDYNTVYIVI